MLRAAQVVVEEGLARPILIGRPAVIEARLERFGLSIRPGRDFELINPEDDPRYRDYVADLCRGGRPRAASRRMRRARWCAPTPPSSPRSRCGAARPTP